MKRLFRKFKEKLCGQHQRFPLGFTLEVRGSDGSNEIRFNKEDLPPPYEENAGPVPVFYEERIQDRAETSVQQIEPFDGLDLLANCNIAPIRSDTDTDVSYAEIQEPPAITMGIWHSTPLSKRHKSKISLTWVLKENLENTERKVVQNDYQNHRQLINERESLKKERHSRLKKERVVGRNEQILKCKSVSDLVVSCSNSEDEGRRRRHRHRKKKRPRSGKVGYDIKDLDCFLSEASIDRPGNIPLVIAQPATLYQTQYGDRCALPLPAGAVVNAVFQSRQWVYAQTAHGHEGYVPRAACLPLPILPNRQSPQKKTPCWESSTDIYPRPCGNLTDTEKEQLRGRTRSECRYRPKSEKRRTTKSCAEEEFDSLYLKSRSYCSNIDKIYDDHRPKKPSTIDKIYDEYRLKKPSSIDNNHRLKKKKSLRQTLLVVNSDYKGVKSALSVSKGEVVTLVQSRKETDMDPEWFYVRKRDGEQGFIPAAVAGHGYI